MTRETFAAFDDNVRLLKCYIDDGLLVWRGPLDRLEEFFAGTIPYRGGAPRVT
jgi:hypothetical protein